MNIGLIVGIIFVILIIAGVLVVVGLRREEADPLEARLAEFAERGEVASLREVEMSAPFVERVILPMANKLGQFALKFTPQKALDDIQQKLEQAGNPKGLNPTNFLAIRFLAAFGILAFMTFLFSASDNPNQSTFMKFAMTVGFSLIGFALPNLLITSKINSRREEVRKALPDAMDLLTICVEAGLGFEAAMKKVQEKWEDELAMAFGRALQEIQLGKVRREALRDMADRIGLQELDSFVAAVIQSEQLGVSMAKIMRIQSDDMRTKRRQMAEQEAQKAPVKMLIPMTLLIFPTIMLILMGPAILMMARKTLVATFGGG